MTSAQNIYPVADMKNGISSKEGDTVSLTCNYETSETYVRLYWYKQQSEHLAPQFILWKGARDYSSSEYIPDQRYKCQTGQEESKLNITEVTLADTAVYYCALDTQ